MKPSATLGAFKSVSVAAGLQHRLTLLALLRDLAHRASCGNRASGGAKQISRTPDSAGIGYQKHGVLLMGGDCRAGDSGGTVDRRTPHRTPRGVNFGPQVEKDFETTPLRWRQPVSHRSSPCLDRSSVLRGRCPFERGGRRTAAVAVAANPPQERHWGSHL